MKSKDLLLVSLLFLFASIIRISQLATNSLSLWSDDAIYTIMAKEFYEGNPLSLLHPHWQPFFPFVISIFYIFLHEWPLAPFVVSTLFGALLVIPFYYFLHLLTKNRLIAFFFSLYITLFTPLLLASASAYSESLFIFVVWSAIPVLWLSFVTQNRRLSFFAGVLLGLGYLTKSEGILPFVSYLVFIFVYLAFYWKKGEQAYVKRVIQTHLIIIVAGFMLIFVGHRIALTLKYGYYSPLSKYYYLHARPGSAFELSQDGNSTWAQDVWNPWTANPQLDIYRYPKNYNGRFKFFMELMWERTIGRAQLSVSEYISPYLGIVRTILLIMGLFWIPVYCKKKSFSLFLITTFGLTFVGLMIFAPAPGLRYLYFWLPVLPLLFALGTLTISKLLGIKNKSILLFLLLILIASHFYINKSGIRTDLGGDLLHQILGDRPPTFSPLEKADRWLLENNPGKRIMSTHEGTAVLSRSVIIYPPLVYTLPELVDYARKQNVSYIIAGENTIHSDLLFLFYEPRDYSGLQLVNIEETDFVIYKVIENE